MERKLFIGGNWKCNLSLSEVKSLCSEINEKLQSLKNIDVIIAPPSIYIPIVFNEIKCDVKISAQNCNSTGNGAYTGEISPMMLKDFKIDWVILGHSERRKIYHETDEEIAKKIKFAINKELNVIACIGETLEERKTGFFQITIQKQLSAIKKENVNWEKIVIAYEPVWAIGTGLIATTKEAEEAHSIIREWIKENISIKIAENIRIIYGGSVKPNNSKNLLKLSNVDGFLVGGASLNAKDFGDIIMSGN